ncbi:hypothetical protein I41_54880 [Lacipirellula limnantheis]|uniref:Uncharacterized protein n=1 Tax=Lacipirellula limnantheis TaxID=2528024 RepID=A0A517U6I6_9BACT|nr:hypothetical protein I41_54880 [Lacipirellula limnantheis]
MQGLLKKFLSNNKFVDKRAECLALPTDAIPATLSSAPDGRIILLANMSCAVTVPLTSRLAEANQNGALKRVSNFNCLLSMANTMCQPASSLRC